MIATESHKDNILSGHIPHKMKVIEKEESKDRVDRMYT